MPVSHRKVNSSISTRAFHLNRKVQLCPCSMEPFHNFTEILCVLKKTPRISKKMLRQRLSLPSFVVLGGSDGCYHTGIAQPPPNLPHYLRTPVRQRKEAVSTTDRGSGCCLGLQCLFLFITSSLQCFITHSPMILTAPYIRQVSRYVQC